MRLLPSYLALVAALAVGCAASPRPDPAEAAALEADATAMLASARQARRALETAETMLAADMPADPARRRAWAATLEQLRSALRDARAREEGLALLVE